MLDRRCLISLGLVLLTAACADGVAPPAPGSTPHFVKWAPGVQRQFVPLGASRSDELADAMPSLALVTPVPPAVDQSSSAAGDGQTLSWTHNGGTGANRLMLVSVSLLTASRPVASVTFKGVALSFLGARNNDDNATRVELWYCVAPPTGSGTVVVTRTAGDETVAGAVTLTGVDQNAPLGGFVSGASTGSGSSTATVALTSAAGELVVDAVAVKGGSTLTVGGGQTPRYNRRYDEDVTGAGSTEPGAASVTMSWTRSSAAKWALGAVAVKPAPRLALAQYQAAFWAVRGQSRSIAIDYATGAGSAPFLRFTTADPTFVPGLGTLAPGDSVLITVTVDPWVLAVELEPNGLKFGQPAQLKLWYGGAGGDLNGDDLVDGADADIESRLLGIWYQAGDSPWSPIPSTKSVSEKSLESYLEHFSGYAVSW